MSADPNSTDQLQHSLKEAIALQLQEIPDNTDLQSDEALAQQIWQQEMAAVAPPPQFTAAKNPPRPRRAPQTPAQDCSSCLETTPDRNLVTLHCCQTAFCKTCFRTWFETALDGKVLPSCCGSKISIYTYGTCLTATMRRKYEHIREELRADKKIYCGNGKCGKFIKTDDDSPPFVRCRYCKCKTCTSCKELMSAHGKRTTCPNYLQDEEMQQILATNQWRRCPSCLAPVEKSVGCNHIRCRCGSEFCFRCGDRKRSEWDQCRCRAEGLDVWGRVAGQVAAPVVEPVPRVQQAHAGFGATIWASAWSVFQRFL